MPYFHNPFFNMTHKLTEKFNQFSLLGIFIQS